MDVQWEQLAHKLWLTTSTPRPDPDSLRSLLYTPLEASNFSTQSLVPLEQLQIVERYLWPTFSDNAPHQHVILLAAFINVKRQGNLAAWPTFSNKPQEFSNLFHRILSLNLDSSLSIAARLVLLEFVIGAFQSLEHDFVRKECAPLVSVAIWHNLHSDSFREKELQKNTSRQKAWRSSKKRFDNSDRDAQVKLQFERAWLYTMVLDFLRRLNPSKTQTTNELVYCERFLEFITDLTSQLPTRRYSNVLLKDLNILPILYTSTLYKSADNTLLHDLSDLYKHFSDFQVDDTDRTTVTHESHNEHYEALASLQKVALQHFESKLKVLALSNYAAIDQPGELQSHLSALSDVELEKLCQILDFRTSYPASANISTGRSLFLSILTTTYTRPKDFRMVVRNLSVSPTETSLYDAILLRNETFDSTRPLALPKLNLQYLSLDDFMWRSFKLNQTEAFYEIRKDMENIIRRMKPRIGGNGQISGFDGFSKMGLPIGKPAVIEVGQPRVGKAYPGSVRAEVILDVSRLNDRIRSEWDNLRSKDVVYLLGVKGADISRAIGNGGSIHENERHNIHVIRTAEIVQVLDDNGKPVRDIHGTNGYNPRSRGRRLLLDIDPIAFHADQAQLSRTKGDAMASINIIVRRPGRENNFKPVLETIQRLLGARTELPLWFQGVFLGYGDPKSATHQTSTDQITKIDCLDTFLDWQHLQDSFSDRKIIANEEMPNPPYVLRSNTPPGEEPPKSKKRRREEMEKDEVARAPIYCSTYKPPNNGPYPVDVPRKNTIRFTPKQIDAIISGTHQGLSIIIGPPGTGKTDVATQIINLLYHNYPSERILLVAHSNQALNQLFQKITTLNIDSRHLLRLGHGEEELESEESYSKAGRVESFMENRATYLGEINRLAASMGAEGAHGSTCETADYFNQVFVQPAWSRFWSAATAETATPASISNSFPFRNYFSNAPVTDLIPTTTLEAAREAAQGCKHHLDMIFTELEAIRPFEILRNPRDQANHLLVKEARIIAMTSTHAAMRRSEIADLGFHYDTLVMEEAAQITEIESFIPCALQNPDQKTGELPLKRVVLVGDHLQNSPIVQNLALRQYANFEQSLFLRLVRLGVPTVTLDQQGRCRPSIAELFSWRYENLTNLPHLRSLPEFSSANAGLLHEFQFIDVPDYQGQGEREPTAHFIQNLGEAEYAVALYQYMRLLGYPARSITILATYAGQKALIRDVIEHRCKGNKLFGMPKMITTVDKYQGEQNDYVILSLVRTKTVGYLRDVRRLTVALSRARLGLYVLGRRELFETCLEMKIAMDKLMHEKPDKLQLVTGEMFPTQRRLNEEVSNVAEMDGVEHLGQYVYEMTQAKIKSLGGTLELLNDQGDDEKMDLGDAVEEPADEVDIEEDPLHETVL